MTRRCTVTRCKGRGFLLLGLVAQDEVLLEDVQKLGVGAALRGNSYCNRIIPKRQNNTMLHDIRPPLIHSLSVDGEQRLTWFVMASSSMMHPGLAVDCWLTMLNTSPTSF